MIVLDQARAQLEQLGLEEAALVSSVAADSGADDGAASAAFGEGPPGGDPSVGFGVGAAPGELGAGEGDVRVTGEDGVAAGGGRPGAITAQIGPG